MSPCPQPGAPPVVNWLNEADRTLRAVGKWVEQGGDEALAARLAASRDALEQLRAAVLAEISPHVGCRICGGGGRESVEGAWIPCRGEAFERPAHDCCS